MAPRKVVVEFTEALTCLNTTARSINNATRILFDNPSYSEDLLEVAVSQIKDTTPEYKISFLFLFDSIAQNSIARQRKSLNKKLASCLLQNMAFLIPQPANEQTLRIYEKTISVWKYRCIFTPNIISSLELIIERNSTGTAFAQSLEIEGKQNNQRKITAKVYLKEDIHRIVLQEASFAHLVSLVIESFELREGNFLLKYCDDECDLITIANDSDLENAIDMFSSQPICRFYVQMGEHESLNQDSFGLSDPISEYKQNNYEHVEFENVTAQQRLHPHSFHPERLPERLLRPVSPLLHRL